MAVDDALSKANLNLDDANKIRLLHSDEQSNSIQLKEGCNNFVTKVQSMREFTANTSQLFQQLAKEVEMAKMKAISTRNTAHSGQGAHASHNAVLRAQIAQRAAALERLKLELQSLHNVEAEQMDDIQRLSN